MKPLYLRRALLVLLVVVTGCAAFPPDQIVLSAGEKHCTAATKAECDAMYATAATLHTKEMNAAIAEARR